MGCCQGFRVGLGVRVEGLGNLNQVAIVWVYRKWWGVLIIVT